MFTYFRKSKSQKELFFQLSNAIAIESYEKSIRGVYVIFKDNVCVYVGQSSNVASRLATHLSGRYSDSDKIFIFESTNDEDLITTEKYLIQKLQPIENLLVDFDEKINTEDIFDIFYDYEKGAYENILDYYDFCIINDKPNLFIFNADIQPELYTIRKCIKDLMISPLVEGNKNA